MSYKLKYSEYSPPVDLHESGVSPEQETYRVESNVARRSRNLRLDENNAIFTAVIKDAEKLNLVSHLLYFVFDSSCLDLSDPPYRVALMKRCQAFSFS